MYIYIYVCINTDINVYRTAQTQYFASIIVVSYIFTYFSICFFKNNPAFLPPSSPPFSRKASRETLAQRLRLAADGTFVAESSDELLGAPWAVEKRVWGKGENDLYAPQKTNTDHKKNEGFE